MSEKITTVLILIIAVIHLLPVAGFFGVSRLESLYNISIDDKNLEILMRHRAILFGLLGIFLAYTAFKPALQPMAFFAAFISISSFFYLTYSIGEYNSAIKKVVIADFIAAICLALAVIFYVLTIKNQSTNI